MKSPIILLAASLAFAGCLQSNISGGTNGSPGTGNATSSATGSGTATGAGPTATAAGTSTGTGTGTGTASASSAGSSTGSSTGTGTGSGSSGSSTGAGTTTGACLGFEDGTCNSNAACCSGACLEICREPEGHACLTDDDCSSGNCVNDSCACASASQGQQQTYCASDADCCNGIPCQLTDYGPQYGQYGICCNPIGGSCGGSWDCCDGNCVNGTCACLDVDTEGCQAGECCTGECVGNANGGGISACLSGPGDPCVGPWACANSHCVDGVCGTCSGATGGVCATTADCCAGGTCAENLVANGGPFGFGGPALDAGLACCAGVGESCDGGENARVCCSGACSDGSCTCARVTDQCYNSASCCAGEACMTRDSSGSGGLACCQIEGQFCLASYECCSGNCADQACACVVDGGACGPAGYWAAEGAAACCSGVCGDAGACL